jgi:hypothetical protein
MSTDKINAAITDCLNYASSSPSPLTAMAEYLARLRADPAWTNAEVDIVERRVLRMLKALMGQSDDTDSSQDEPSDQGR